jgi:hypothetical protein
MMPLILQDDILIKDDGNHAASCPTRRWLNQDGDDAANKTSWSLAALLHEPQDPTGVGRWQFSHGLAIDAATAQ